MKWITEGKDCSAKVGCSHLGLCRECQTNPFCGWCDDGSNTGLGSCQSGTSIGSVYGNSSSNVISTPTQGATAGRIFDSFYTSCKRGLSSALPNSWQEMIK